MLSRNRTPRNRTHLMVEKSEKSTVWLLYYSYAARGSRRSGVCANQDLARGMSTGERRPKRARTAPERLADQPVGPQLAQSPGKAAKNATTTSRVAKPAKRTLEMVAAEP